MHLVYEDNPLPYQGRPMTSQVLAKLDAVKGYLKHYENYMYLSFMLANGDRAERQQASKELVKCEKKIKWWTRLPQYDQTEVIQGIIEIKKKWGK